MIQVSQTVVTSESKSSDSLYEVLGVAETATVEEIKRAYFQMVRRFRPTENPEAFQRMNDASRTLGDPRRRGEYDQGRRVGRRVQALLDQAAALLEKDPQKAISLLKSAIALAPDMPRPRHLLAQVLLRVQEFGIAEKQYRWLLKEKPRDETLRFKLARCLWLQGRREDAELELRLALTYNPLYHDALMLLARMQEADGYRQSVIETLERAIANDGRENFADFDALLRLYGLYVASGAEAEIEQTARRLAAIVPPDDTDRILRVVRRIRARAEEALHAEDFGMAAGLLALTPHFPIADEALAAEIVGLTTRIPLAAEARTLQNDLLITGALEECIYLKYLDRSSENLRRDRLEAVLTQLQTEINVRPREMARDIEYLRREYPGIAADQSALLQGLVQRIVKRLEVIGPEHRQSHDSSTPSVMPATITLPEAQPVADGDGATRRGGLLGWLRGGNTNGANR